VINQPPILSKADVARYRNLKQSKFREQERLFLLEGVRLCEEAFNSNLDITCCITVKGFDKVAIPAGLSQLEANQTQLEQISDSRNPQGIICIANIPKPSAFPSPGAKAIVLVADRISDPGNLGTIFRTALWFGVTDILLGPGCVDPYNPKVVRSSMGAIVAINLHFSDDLISSVTDWQKAGGNIVALHMSGEPLNAFKPKKGLILIIGSEAHGVDPELLELSRCLSIEKPGQGESLNAAMATGIALYELNRK
jgi:TrmH family RNA methyltransferase